MITLNDYLYSGETIFGIIDRYSEALRLCAQKNHSLLDQAHCNFLLQIREMLEHNEFLTAQSESIRDFYLYMVEHYPELAFTFRGRIKSLIRAEEKFNGYIVEFIPEYLQKYGKYPTEAEIRERLARFRDLIAYRIVISVPRSYLRTENERDSVEMDYLYRIANALPDFLEQRGFSAEVSGREDSSASPLLAPAVRPYYRDYVAHPEDNGYQSLHITFYDIHARGHVELQLRTKKMDDYAEIGAANHPAYEKHQQEIRARRNMIPEGESVCFDEAYERILQLQELDLSKVDVNMFTALNNTLINDSCGLFRGRAILPHEHLSRYQNDKPLF